MGNRCCSSSENENGMDTSPLLEQIQDVSQLDDFISLIEELLLKKTRENTNSSTQEIAGSSRLHAFINFGSDLLEKVSKRVDRQACKMCFLPKFSRETKVVIEVLKEFADIHWLVAGLSVVAYVMEQIDQVADNKSQCVRLLRYSCALAKRIKHLNRHLPDENEKLNEGVNFIVEGSLMCLSQMRSREFSRIVFASVNAADLQNFEDQIRRTYPDLILAGVTALLEKIPDVLPPSKGDDPNAVGIEEAIDRVTELLSIDTIDQSKRAVVIYGVGGAGKTTLTKTVFTRLDLKAYKFCRLLMEENCSNQHLEQLQQPILSALFGKDIALNDIDEGQEELSKNYFRELKQPLFMFIDNALKRRDLANFCRRTCHGFPSRQGFLLPPEDLMRLICF